MDTSRIGAEAVDLISKITGKKLKHKDISPAVIFLASLVTILLGVSCADNDEKDPEKQRLREILDRFIPKEGNIRQLTDLIIKGVRERQVYKNLAQWQILVSPLSQSERLLLIGLGCDMAVADGEMDILEKKYLQLITNHLGIDAQYLDVLEAGFKQQEYIEAKALSEVRHLLNPARFHVLNAIFVKAASDLIAALPQQVQQQPSTKSQPASRYKQLNQFQSAKKTLTAICEQVGQIIQTASDRHLLPQSLLGDIENLVQQLKSHRFRIAVIGEFSQGKSTLMNALVGAEIQPVRVIPCSSTVTILKYGSHKRVIGRDRHGDAVEIPVDEYQTKASIPKAMALEERIEALANSEFGEITYEHPDLELCGNSVELVDSPGLNEHPNREAIAQEVLQGTDAILFLTNAAKLLTVGEQELLQDLHQIIGHGQSQSIENLFIVVNFIDLLRQEEEQQKSRQLIENFVCGDAPMITGEHRIHLISAQAALDAILDGNEDAYLESFHGLTEAIAKFLTSDRGYKFIDHAVHQLQELMQSCLSLFDQATAVLDDTLQLSPSTRQKILAQISQAKEYDIKLQEVAVSLQHQARQAAHESWQKYELSLIEHMIESSKNWHSHYSHLFDHQKQLIVDYTTKFARELRHGIDVWANTQLSAAILNPQLAVLDATMQEELVTLRQSIKDLDTEVYLSFAEQLNFTIRTTPILFPTMSISADMALLGIPILDFLEADRAIKAKICEVGINNFRSAKDQFLENLDQMIAASFSDRMAAARKGIQQVIANCENLLEQVDKVSQANIEQRVTQKTWISEQKQELERLQQDLALGDLMRLFSNETLHTH